MPESGAECHAWRTTTIEGPTGNPPTPRGASTDRVFGDSLVRRTYASHGETKIYYSNYMPLFDISLL